MRPLLFVIEDEPELAEMLRVILRSSGFEVTLCEDPALALDQIPLVRPDAVLIDLMLPGMSGLDLARRLLAGGSPHVPMVAMSASRQLLEQARASRLFQGTVAKPFDISTLVDCMEYCAAQHAVAAPESA